MLTRDEHPVAWAMLVWEMADAHEHLGELVARMTSAGEIDEAGFAIHLGHVFAHLNRSWHGRADPYLGDVPEDQFQARSQFPTDLSPVG